MLLVIFYSCWSNKDEDNHGIDLPHEHENNCREYERDEDYQQEYRRESKIPNNKHIWSKKKNIKLLKKF